MLTLSASLCVLAFSGCQKGDASMQDDALTFVNICICTLTDLGLLLP